MQKENHIDHKRQEKNQRTEATNRKRRVSCRGKKKVATVFMTIGTDKKGGHGMSAEAVIHILAEAVEVHQELNQVAETKTELIKQNKVAALDSLIRKESKLVHKLQIVEKQREQQVHAFFQWIGGEREHATISEMVGYVSTKERELLSELQYALLDEIYKLRKSNELNQSLIAESLQFVNLSLDLLNPGVEELQYRRPEEREESNSRRNPAIFDSKA